MIDDSICIRILQDAYSTKDHIITSEMQEIIANDIGDEDIYRSHAKHILGLGLVEDAGLTAVCDRFIILNLTSKGIMHLQGSDSLAAKVNTINIQLNPNTISNLADLIINSNITQKQKDGLLAELSKHGAKEFITKGVGYLTNNPKELIKILLLAAGITT